MLSKYDVILFAYNWDEMENNKIKIKYYPDIDIYNNDIDICVIPCSNWLNTSFKINHYSKLTEHLPHIKFIYFGLGIQAELNKSLFISDDIAEFIEVSKKHKSVFIVRGEDTKTYLEKHVSNERIISTGCPSIFINNDLNLGQKINDSVAVLKDMINIRMGFHLSQKMSLMTEFEKKYISLLDKGATSFPQTEWNIINSLYYDNGNKYAYQSRGNKIVFNKTNLKYFFNVYDEIEYIKNNIDIIITNRIHGAIKGISSGTPTLLVYHDKRTYELSRILRIPSISQQEFIDNQNTLDLVDLIKDKYIGFDENRELLKNRLTIFTGNIGLDLNF